MLNTNSARSRPQRSLSGSVPCRAVPRFDFFGEGGGQGKLSGRGYLLLSSTQCKRACESGSMGPQGDRSWDAEKSLVRRRAMEAPLQLGPRLVQGGLAGLDGLVICTASPLDSATVVLGPLSR
jgi:hypothetical protein